MFSIFPLWTFHLFLAPFQQHLHMEYTSLSRWFRCCGSYRDFRDRGILLTRKLLNKWFLLLSWSLHFECFTVTTMALLTVTEYLCHKWPRICSKGHKYFPVLSSFMTYHRLCNWSDMTGVTSVAGATYPSGAPEFAPIFLLTSVGLMLSITCFHVFSSVLWFTLRFPRKDDVRSSLPPCFVGSSWFFLMIFVFIYGYKCPERFVFQKMFVSSISNTTGVTRWKGTANHSGAHVFTSGFTQ